MPDAGQTPFADLPYRAEGLLDWGPASVYRERRILDTTVKGRVGPCEFRGLWPSRLGPLPASRGPPHRTHTYLRPGVAGQGVSGRCTNASCVPAPPRPPPAPAARRLHAPDEGGRGTGSGTG